MISLLFWGLNCTYTPPEPVLDYKEPTIRVALMKEAKDVTLKVRGRYQIVNLENQEVLTDDRVLPFNPVFIKDQKICIAEECFPSARLRIVPSRDFSLLIYDQERRYRGQLDILGDQPGGLLLINRLGIEDYVRGVLPHEISERWPLEAIKSQAVAARSYAMYQIKLSGAKLFDVTGDIYSQVYGGLTAEHYRTNIAVERTRARVLMYQGQILPAYFHATCGGQTENAAELWKHDSVKPLGGVLCGFCMVSPHYKWKKELRLKDIQDLLNKKGYALGAIQDIEVTERNSSGRIRQLSLTTKDGKQLTLSGKDFRQIMGPNIIRSNCYRVSVEGEVADFTGYGWGHGVGLCQWGALGMARRGYDYTSILMYYYPGAELNKL